MGRVFQFKFPMKTEFKSPSLLLRFAMGALEISRDLPALKSGDHNLGCFRWTLNPITFQNLAGKVIKTVLKVLVTYAFSQDMFVTEEGSDLSQKTGGARNL